MVPIQKNEQLCQLLDSEDMNNNRLGVIMAKGLGYVIHRSFTIKNCQTDRYDSYTYHRNFLNFTIEITFWVSVREYSIVNINNSEVGTYKDVEIEILLVDEDNWQDWESVQYHSMHQGKWDIDAFPFKSDVEKKRMDLWYKEELHLRIKQCLL